VIADEATGEVIARATTAPRGRPHAETIAIAAAGERARGAARMRLFPLMLVQLAFRFVPLPSTFSA
jgi:hypothetical protein